MYRAILFDMGGTLDGDGLHWLDRFVASYAEEGLVLGRDTIRAAFDEADRARLMADEGIVRNRLKIESTVSNAAAFLAVQREFGSFDRYIWQFVGGKPIVGNRRTHKQIPASTPESDAMSKDMKKRGFRFVGSTICYAFMQATGMVNDHLVTCFRYRARK